MLCFLKISLLLDSLAPVDSGSCSYFVRNETEAVQLFCRADSRTHAAAEKADQM